MKAAFGRNFMYYQGLGSEVLKGRFDAAAS